MRPGLFAAPRCEAPPPVVVEKQDREEPARFAKKRRAQPRAGVCALTWCLREWAKATDAIRSMHYRFTQIEKDKVFCETHKSEGEVQLLKPHLLRIDRREGSRSTVLLFTGETIHLYNSAKKTELIFKQPEDGSFCGGKPSATPWADILSGKAMGEGLRQFAFWLFAGLPVRELPKRFQVLLAKEDAWYVYLDILPRHARDKGYFDRMRVVLHKNGFRVRQIWLQHLNGNEMTLDFPRAGVKAKITPASIREGLPRDFERIAIPVDPEKSLPKK